MTTMKVLIVYDERVIAREVLTKLREALGEKYKVSVESVINCHGCDKELNYSYDEKELR
jgi:hypothetical protein